MISEMIIHPDELSKKWVDRLADANIRVLGIHPVGGKEAVSSLTSLLESMSNERFTELLDYASDRGIEIEYEIHAAGYLMPKSLFNEHTEYFRMNEKGERVCDWNFCVSNIEALGVFSKNAATLATSLYKSSHRFNFWMDDGRDIYCHCPQCKQISPSDQQLVAVNAMLTEIKKIIPDARIPFLAYVDSIVVPCEVRPTEGVFLEYAPFEKYTAKGEDAEERIEREKKMIEPLLSFFGKNDSKVLEYWYDNSLYSKWKKPPVKFELDKTKMQEDIEEYIRLGFDRMATFACFLGNDYEELYGEIDVLPYGNACKLD